MLAKLAAYQPSAANESQWWIASTVSAHMVHGPEQLQMHKHH
jgi:hypothetical protein